MEISFVILSWNSRAYLEKSLESIVAKCRGEGIPFEAVVVDNGSCDGSVALVRELEEKYPGHFRMVTLDRNLGTTYTRNLGLKLSTGKFLCIVDSDTEFHSGSLRDACQLLEARPQVGMLVPQLILPDGNVQHSVKRFPTLWHKLVKIPRILFGIRTANSDFYPDFPFQEQREVDSAISACWIFKRDLLTTVGYLDERIFYSPEDLDFCHRIRKAGYRIIYHPALKILHHTQQITHKNPFSRLSFSHFCGLIYYYCKHGGWLLRPTFEE